MTAGSAMRVFRYRYWDRDRTIWDEPGLLPAQKLVVLAYCSDGSVYSGYADQGYPIPRAGIAAVTGCTLAAIDEAMAKAVELGLILQTDDGYWEVSRRVWTDYICERCGKVSSCKVCKHCAPQISG